MPECTPDRAVLGHAGGLTEGAPADNLKGTDSHCPTGRSMASALSRIAFAFAAVSSVTLLSPGVSAQVGAGGASSAPPALGPSDFRFLIQAYGEACAPGFWNRGECLRAMPPARGSLRWRPRRRQSLSAPGRPQSARGPIANAYLVGAGLDQLSVRIEFDARTCGYGKKWSVGL
jgi:hypothetical protein